MHAQKLVLRLRNRNRRCNDEQQLHPSGRGRICERLAPGSCRRGRGQERGQGRGRGRGRGRAPRSRSGVPGRAGPPLGGAVKKARRRGTWVPPRVSGAFSTR